MSVWFGLEFGLLHWENTLSRLRLHISFALVVVAALIGGCGGQHPDGVRANSNLEAAEKAASAKSRLVGHAAPDFALADQVAQQISLKSLRGSWVVLYLYPKDDMPPCTCDATKFTTCLISFANFKDAKFVAITDLSVPNIEAFLDAYKIKLDILSDRDHTAMAAYGDWSPGENGKPGSVGRSTVLIDPQGVIRHHWVDVAPVGHAGRVARRLAELKGGGATSRPDSKH
jgi:peroxiredoxin Q/BCP